MRVRFKKDSSANHTMYEGTQWEFTSVSMGHGFRTDIKNTINWDETPEGELVEADVPEFFKLIGAKYIERKIGNKWI